MASCPHCRLNLPEAELPQEHCPHCQQPLTGGKATMEVTPEQVTLIQSSDEPLQPAHKTVNVSRTVSGDLGNPPTIDSADFSAADSDSQLARTIDSTDLPAEGCDSRFTPTIDSAYFSAADSDSQLARTIESTDLPAEESDSRFTPTIDSASLSDGNVGAVSWAVNEGVDPGSHSDSSVTIDSSIAVPPRPDSKYRSSGSGSPASSPQSVDDIDRRLRQVWGSQVASAQPQMTMRGGSAVREEFDEHSTLIIRQRALSTVGESAPSTLVDYDLLNVLGEGGMGVVYNARQASIDREVAVKMLKPEMTANATHRRKFLSEVAVTGELDHPNIVPIYDLGQNADGALFYSMKKVTGTPWSQVIRKTPLVENLTILMKVADAIAFAHSRGVVHRDLKPENVMLGDYGEVLVLDWGLALATDGHRPTPNVCSAFNIAGSPAYMAPELVFGPMEAIGRHSDIYLLGAILYECITGRPPHGGKSAKDCLKNAARNVILPTDKHGELLDIAMRAMHTDPQRRHSTVQAFQQAIRDYQAHSESIALCERADAGLQLARQSNDYQDYSRTLFAYEEALQLWPGNESARRGVTRTRLEYAVTALGKSDFDLGLSLVDSANEEHADVRQQLLSAKSERDARQQRLARARRTMAALAAVIFLSVSGGVVVASYLAYQARQSELKAVASAAEAEQSAERARKSAAKEKKSAEQAKISEDKAVENQKLAERETGRARAAEREAVSSAYTALIAMAAARIEENAFDQARLALEQCDEQLRGWEWRRLMHVVQQGDVTRVPLESRSEVIAVSSRGNLVASGGSDGVVRLWNRATRQTVGERPRGESPARITALAFHPMDDQWLVIGLSEGPQPLVAWNRTTGELRVPTNDHRHAAGVVQVTFSADGQLLLSASHDRTARLWSWETLLPRTFAGHVDTVWSAALSPDGKKVATASEDGTVRIWDAASGVQLRSPAEDRRIPFAGHQGPVYAVAFLPAPETALSAAETTTASGEPAYYLASAGYDRRVLLWQTDKLIPFDIQGLVADLPVAASAYEQLLGHTAQVRSLAVSSDGTRLASAASDHTIRIWQLQTTGVARRGTLIKELRGHAGPVYAATFVPGDAGRIVSTGYDNQLRMWSIDEYDEEQTLPGVAMRGHVGPVLSARFSTDGEQIVTASLDRTARTWRTADGSVNQVFREGHAYLASRALFFPASRRLLTAGGDGTARIWDLERQAELRSFERTGYRAAVDISPDEQWIVSGSSDLVSDSARPHGAIIFSAESGQRRHSLADAHKAPVTCVAWSPKREHALVFTGDDNGVFQLWDPNTGLACGPRIDQHASPISAAEFAMNGEWLVTADAGGHVLHWDISNPTEIKQVHEYRHPAGVQAIALTEGGKHLLTGCADGRLRLFAAQGSEPIWMAESLSSQQGQFISAESPSPESIPAVALGWDAAKEIAVAVAINTLRRQGNSGSDAEEEYLRLFELDFARGEFREIAGNAAEGGGYLVNLRNHGAAGWSVALSADGRQIVTVGRDEARLWDRGGNELASYRPHQDLTFAEFSPGGDLVLTASLDTSVRIWDGATGQPRMTLDAHSAGLHGGHRGTVNCAVFAPDSNHVFTASDDGTVRQWNLATMQVEQKIDVDPQGVTRLVLSRDGQTLVTASRSGIAAIWRVADPREPQRLLRGHSGEILDLCLTDDNQWIVTASADNTARIWNLASGQEVLKLEGHSSEVTAVATLADERGLRILTGSNDKTAKLWAIRGLGGAVSGDANAQENPEAQELLSLRGHTRGLTSVDFAEGGRAALTAARDGLTIVWPAVPAARRGMPR